MSVEDLTRLDSSSFDDFVRTHEGIVLFHKKLCPHCKVMETVIGKVAAQIPMSLAAVDSEEEPALMEKVGAERVPTLALIRGGEVRAVFTGIKNPREVIAWYQGNQERAS